MSRTKIIEEIAAERERQVSVEGWTEAHDDGHRDGELAYAAAAYVLCDISDKQFVCELFPWSRDHWEKMLKKDPRRRLIVAAALIVAEIGRLDRAAAVQP